MIAPSRGFMRSPRIRFAFAGATCSGKTELPAAHSLSVCSCGTLLVAASPSVCFLCWFVRGGCCRCRCCLLCCAHSLSVCRCVACFLRYLFSPRMEGMVGWLASKLHVCGCMCGMLFHRHHTVYWGKHDYLPRIRSAFAGAAHCWLLLPPLSALLFWGRSAHFLGFAGAAFSVFRFFCSSVLVCPGGAVAAVAVFSGGWKVL